MNGPGERLDSWKAIADYLGRDRTTVMRWERTAGLPVRRVQGQAGRSVFAFKSELDQWLAAAPVPPAPATADPAREPRRGFRWAVILPAVAVALAAAGAVWRFQGAPAIAKATLVGEQIVAADASGREVWRYGLPHIDGNIVAPRFLITDIDRDGRPDVLAAVHFMKQGGDAYGTVMAIGASGALRWQRTLQDTYVFGGEEYGPAWFPEDILAYQSRGATRIAVAQHHHTWWPGVVVTYDGNGQAIDRFVHTGWLRRLNISADGKYLLAAGISNSFGGAALAALDAAHPSGTSPSGGSLPPCGNCPSGAPVAYFVAPWSELARPSDTPNAAVFVDRAGEIQWHATQRADQSGKDPDVIIAISPNLELVRQDENKYFAELRVALNRSDLRAPRVHGWTQAEGWR